MMKEKKGMERWRIAQGWGSFAYYDEPRSYYDPEKKDAIFYGQNKKIGRPKGSAKAKEKK